MKMRSYAVHAVALLLAAVACFFGTAVDSACPTVTPKANFINAALIGTWYTVQITKSTDPSQTDLTCIKEINFVNGNGGISTTRMSKSLTNGKSAAFYTGIPVNGNQAQIEFTTHAACSDPIYTFTDTYLDADFSYFVLRLTCNTSTSDYRVELLSARKSASDEIIQNVQDTLSKAGIPTELMPVSQKNCD